MKITHYDLGNLEKGRIVEVNLQGGYANVHLLDNSNYENYKNNRLFHHIGGLVKQPSIRLRTSHSAHWHITIDLKGLQGSVESTARVIPLT